jgi:Las17-binding protein actin regulator
VFCALAAGVLLSCSTAPSTREGRDELLQKDRDVAGMEPARPGGRGVRQEGLRLRPVPGGQQGWAGSAYGRGVVYEQGQHIGYADLTQGTFGLQAGGQTYSELIVFENKAAMDRLKKNQIDFGANASAIIAKTGAAANARFVDGVAVFVRPTAGAMAEAAIGGQRVTYVPK